MRRGPIGYKLVWNFNTLFALHYKFLGDPDDRTLRKMEADVLIPDRMSKRLNELECHAEMLGIIFFIALKNFRLLRMFKDKRLYMGFRVFLSSNFKNSQRLQKRKVSWSYSIVGEPPPILSNGEPPPPALPRRHHCCILIFRFRDPKFHQEVTEEYLKERSEYRRTGKSVNERNWEAYREWKQTQATNSNK